MHSIDGSAALSLPPPRLAPLEWSDADEAFPFVVPEWESLGLASISPKVMGRHWLVLGDSGSGKTKSVIVPIAGAALRHRADDPRHRAAVLVIDPKFDLAPIIESLIAQQERKLITLDVDSCDRRISLFEGVRHRYSDPRDAVEYTLRNCSPAYVNEGDSKEQFWRVSGFQIIQALVGTDLACRAACNVSIWSLLLSELPEAARKTLRGFGLSTRDDNYYENARAFCAASVNRETALLQFADVCDAHKLPQYYTSVLRGLAGAPDGQRGSQISMAFQFLNELTHRELNAVVDLRPPGTGRGDVHYLSIHDIVENGEVLLFSPGLGTAIHDVVGRIVKTKFFEASFARHNKARPVFYICDEFQRFITSDPQSGEQSFLDRCRAYRVTCALATQSMASLAYGLQQARGGAGNVSSVLGILMNNTGNKLFFRNTDPETQETLERLFPRSPDANDPSLLALRPVSSLGVGECYFLFSDGRVGRGGVRLGASPDPSEIDVGSVPAVRLMGPMTFESVLALCDNIERLVRFQRATEINIEIDSPGGSAGSLQYLAAKIASWRAQGVRFHTTALLTVASAAAWVLSLGDIGCRRAHRFSRIMYHNWRYIPTQATPITKETALRLIDDLSHGDGAMEELLLEHLFPLSRSESAARTIDFDSAALKELDFGISGVQTLDRSLFQDIYRKLTLQERFLTAEQAQLVGFIDCVI